MQREESFVFLPTGILQSERRWCCFKKKKKAIEMQIVPQLSERESEPKSTPKSSTDMKELVAVTPMKMIDYNLNEGISSSDSVGNSNKPNPGKPPLGRS